MTAAEQIEVPRRRRSASFRIGIALAILLSLALVGVWLARVPIATRFIDRRFTANGVAARYRIADLGFGRQRLTNVVIGDPAHPDLVADWIETYTDLSSGGPKLSGVRAGHVRLRGRLVDGRVSLGAIDRLLPAPSGKPFALPAIDLAVSDARMRLETPAGTIGLRLAGSGRLDDGFRGTLAATSTRLAAGGCTIARSSAVLAVAIRRAAPEIAGPVRGDALACAGVTAVAPQVTLDARLSPALDRWSGGARVALDNLSRAGARIADLAGAIGFTGNAARTEGSAKLTGGAFAVPEARGHTASFDGIWRVAAGRVILAGRAGARGVALDAGRRQRFASIGGAAAGTPAAPLASAVAAAAERAARGFDVAGELAVGNASGRLLATFRQLALSSASGARATLGEGEGIALGNPAGLRLDGVATLGGGGLPAIRVTLAQPRAGAPVTGIATIAPYAARGARLALTPVRFTAGPGGTTRIATVATLSGPLADGHIDGLRTPLAARWDGARLVVNPACAPLAFDRLALAGLVLRPARLALCPIEGALLRTDRGRMSGGARLAAPRLAGTLGSWPITLAANGVEVRIGARGFRVDALETRIGSAARITRLDFAQLEGVFGARGIAGRFAGGAGQIGNVPLLLSDAAGQWALAGGALSLGGALTVSDAATDARFKPLATRDVTLTLARGTIDARGTLYEPTKAVKVADVTIRHRLGDGTGTAHLTVPGITFGEGFQPEELTRLAFGVIADVKGSVSGDGDIAWTSEGVTSTGTFRTANTDLAAAFGPVAGVSGEIRFTDLLALESAPGQIATVASINPGVPVTDGRIVYRTLPGNRVAVESGRWPFAGGTLTLDPTLLDFSAEQQRRLTFHVSGMEAAQFLQQFDFKNLDATGVFDGVLPMVFDQSGGRIERGTLTVRAGGGTLAYVGDLTEKDLGTWGNIAFQALKSLRYRNLDIVMNGPLAGEMITEVRFAGVSQGAGAKSNFLVRRLQKLPFVFNIRIKAPFRGLLDSAASFYDPKRLIERNLPALLEEQSKRSQPPKADQPQPPPSIQPPASEIMP